ncbi:MAG: serine/threonine-protein kinase [Gemmataceae bacterium]
MNETADRTESLFVAVVALPTAEERAAYLEQACGDDPALRGRVEALLRAHDRAGHLLDRPALRDPERTGAYVPPSEQPGTVVAGRYKLLEQIGEGGMGTVWVAEQTAPVRRKVALKLVKAGMDSKAVLSRFEAERQALALMDHPNIAKVLDGGTTETGRPFFAMEYVKGVPITQYCDDARLSIAERLALFVPVCQAVQHAHQKGIIHRDLKPSNVLVCLYDGQPIPKVIDFGLAKAIHQPLTERTLHTAHGVMMGTPLYMSPEQAEFNNLDVDTRTDVYALGVILYELLTGTTPLEKRRFREAAWQEIVRLIKEEEPPKPSTRLGGSGSLPSVAAQRQLEPVKLTKLVRGELDWIVMKALEKDRTRRYETANGFGRDIQRYLADEAVEACPPSARYRLRKFARKHRPALTTAAAIALLLLAATAVSTWQAVRAVRAEERAVAARKAEAQQRTDAETQRDRAVKAEGQAQQSATEAQAVLAFFQDKVLAAGRPEGDHGGLGKDVTLRKALDAARAEVGPTFKDRPVVEASVLRVLGDTYWYLGERESTVPMFERAFELRTTHLGADHPDTLTSMNDLAYVCVHTGKLDRGLALFGRTVELREARLGPDHADTLMSMSDYAEAYHVAGRLPEAIALQDKALKLRLKKFGPDHPDTLTSMDCLATYYREDGQLPKAISLHEETLQRSRKVRGPDHTDTVAVMNNLALAYLDAGRWREALPLLERALTLRQTLSGPDHPDTFAAMTNLASAYSLAGRRAEELALNQQVLALARAKLGPDHPDTLIARYNLAAGYRAGGRLADALPLAEENLKLAKVKLGPDHPTTLRARDGLAGVYQDAGRLAEAQALFAENLTLSRGKLGPEHPLTLGAMGALAEAYQHRGDHARAESLLLDLLPLSKKVLGTDHPDVAGRLSMLGLTYLRQKKFAEAEPVVRECLAIRATKLPDDWRYFNAQSLLGACLLGQKRYAEAEPLLLAGYEGMKARAAKIDASYKVRLPEAVERLVQFAEATNKPDDAAKWRKELDALPKR